MVIEFWINKIIYLGKQYKVLIPTIQNKNTYIVESDSKAFMLYANKNDLIKLAGLLVFATQNKDTIICLPTKQNHFTSYLKSIFNIWIYVKILDTKRLIFSAQHPSWSVPHPK